ncbi:MAG TPA: MFS transporter [Actinophytocola sp.]|jgi:MFS family permease|nr:MFS transporter [Actinophytocola sp.]
MSPRARFVALFAADVISVLGTRVSMLAIPWLVLVTTGSPTYMGLVAGAEMLPYVISGVVATPFADRFGLRRTTIVTDAGSALAMAAITFAPHMGFGTLVVLVAVAGLLRGLGDRVKHVLLRPLAEEAGVPMLRVTTAYEGFSRTAMLVGGSIGGLLIFWFGAAGAIWLDAVTFALCAAIVAAVVPAAEPTAAPPDKADREPYLVALRGGFRALWADPLLPSMIAMLFVLNLFNQALVAVFIPLWVEDATHTPAALGLLFGTFAAGAVLGSIAFTVLAPRLKMYKVFMLGAALAGAPRLLILGVTQDLVLVCTVTFLSGLAMAAVNPVIGAMLYQRIPPKLQTRAFGVCMAVTFTGVPIGGVLAGLAVAGFDLTPAILVGGALCAAATAVVWLRSRSIADVPAEAVAEAAAETEPPAASQPASQPASQSASQPSS